MKKSISLFEKGKSNLWVANYLKGVSDDDNRTSIMGYHLQQSAELLLKHTLEINGVKYPFTHDVKELFLLCSRGGYLNCLEKSTLNEFKLRSDTLTKWGSSTSHVKSFFADYEDVIENMDFMNMVYSVLGSHTALGFGERV